MIKLMRTVTASPSLICKFMEEVRTAGWRSAMLKKNQKLHMLNSPGDRASGSRREGANHGVWTDPDTILVVTHDATRTGAPMLALNIAGTLRKDLHKRVVILMLNGGELEEKFAGIGRVFNLNLAASENPQGAMEQTLEAIRKLGAVRCICNTVVGGRLQPMLARAGFDTIHLIHELPNSITYYGLEDDAGKIAAHGNKVVFSSSYVKEAFCTAYPFKRADARVQVRPQGIYHRNAHADRPEKAKKWVLNELGLGAGSRLVLGCGHADIRKGMDFFCQVAFEVVVRQERTEVHFVWLGNLTDEVRIWANNDLEKGGLKSHVHLVGFSDRAGLYFSAADAFLLTSREAPFPTVVLEAMDAETPVIAFEGAGGAPEVIGNDCGITVPYLDTWEMARSLLLMLDDAKACAVITRRAKEEVDRNFQHGDYVRFLVNSFDPVDTTPVPRGLTGYFREIFEGHGKQSRRDKDFLPHEKKPPFRCALRAVAFYLPQFHPFPENDRWWGRGFTEWTNVTRAVPQFMGHYQPHLPGELGFYDLRLPEVQARQVALARNYGLEAFCFHYYWFGGKTLMEGPVLNFLNHPEYNLGFCLCWANENWTRQWDGLAGEVLIGQEHSPEDDLAFIRNLEKYFRDPRYLKIDGRPVLIVYRPGLLPDPLATVERWRAHLKDTGIGDPYLIATHSFDNLNPEKIGFDATMEFSPNNMPARPVEGVRVVNPDYRGNVFDYDFLVEEGRKFKAPSYKKFRTVCPSWDNEARQPGRGTTFHGTSPEKYGQWLKSVCDHTLELFEGEERLIFINAWNEWAEGCHLEPDRKFGYGYLNVTHGVLKGYDVELHRLVEESREHEKKKQLP